VRTDKQRDKESDIQTRRSQYFAVCTPTKGEVTTGTSTSTCKHIKYYYPNYPVYSVMLINMYLFGENSPYDQEGRNCVKIRKFGTSAITI